MPVHRIPGGPRGSVFALTGELDDWLANSAADLDAAADPAPSLPEASGRRSWWIRLIGRPLRSSSLVVLAALALLASLAAYALQQGPAAQPAPGLPKDETAAALFLEARADWAQRNAGAIGASIAKLQKVIIAEPAFAPAYAALADCYLLAQEFGSMPAPEAFGRAQDAVDAGLRIDPANAEAWRAQGFIDYWWRREPAAARASFERSLSIQPDSAQTYFWYGNALVDNGDFAAGLKHLDKARLLEPVSVALQADYAWALWAAGDEKRSIGMMEDLRSRRPDLATIRDYLSVQYLANGNLAAFVAEVASLAEIRGDPKDIANAEQLKQASSRGDAAVLSLFADQTMAGFAIGDRKTLAWPVYIVSMSGNRAEVVRLLTISAQRKEIWGSAGLVRQIAQRWKDDQEITRLLAARRSPSMVERPN